MPAFYSPSTGGFYLREVHGDAIPRDAIRITDTQHHELLRQQSMGKRIIADQNGVRAVDASAAAPEPRRYLAPLEFRRRFTQAERLRITQAAAEALRAGDPRLQVFLDDLAASREVDLMDPDTIAGIDMLVQASLLTQRRRDAIMAM